MKEKVLEIAKEMLLEAGGDIGQEFPAATNTQLRDWGERLAAVAKECGGEAPRSVARVGLCVRLKFPMENEAVEDIAQEMRSVPRRDEFLYELEKGELSADKCLVRIVDRREMTLAKLADRLDAAIKRREDEAARLWKAVGELEEWLNASHLVQCVLGHYGLQKKEGAK